MESLSAKTFAKLHASILSSSSHESGYRTYKYVVLVGGLWTCMQELVLVLPKPSFVFVCILVIQFVLCRQKKLVSMFFESSFVDYIWLCHLAMKFVQIIVGFITFLMLGIKSTSIVFFIIFNRPLSL